MMKKYPITKFRYAAVAAVMLTIVAGCSKSVLDKKPLDIISDAVVWSDPKLIDAYLNQCYAEMSFYHEMPYGASQDWFDPVMASTFADEAMSAWTPTPRSHWINVSGGVYEYWSYPTVRRLNVFIEKLGTADIDETLKSRYSAEARFLRAFSYFNMVKRYGGVPLITKPQQLDDPEEELYPNRATEEEIYDFIIAELDELQSSLPDDVGGVVPGRPTLFAALALKSRVAMYAASIAQWGTVMAGGVVGINAARANDFWTKSYQASRDIITSAKFSLFAKYEDKTENFRKLFLEKDNVEVIFAEKFTGITGRGHSWDMWQNPFSYNVWAGGQQSSVFLEMVESFENTDGSSPIVDRQKVASGHLFTLDELWGKKDPRFRASVYTHGTSWLGETLDYHDAILMPDGSWNSVGAFRGVNARSRSVGRPTPFGILKYLDEGKGIIPERYYSDTDYIIFRLGEIYLNYAEAAFELGHNSDALWAINEIRHRAGMPALEEVTRSAIRQERKIELAFEGNRYFDLRRWRTATTELSSNYSGLRFIIDGPSIQEGQYDPLTHKFRLYVVENVLGTPTPVFAARNYYLPISLSRTSANPKLVENPGYQ
ncbi:MAG: RagB/SusD family nutrient uptake outer membrane protein [Parapedobacter sp.]|nr:MAG: RagB/SusD family nutrient uptake outer membrane protein [Parapedobacter sp.]